MTEDQGIAEIRENNAEYPSIEQWVIQVNNDMENLTENSSRESGPWRKRSAYRVPPSMKDLWCYEYTPLKVSIGPYHHGEVNLKGMEEHKHRAVVHFLRRSGKPLGLYIDALDQKVGDLKDAYDELDDMWKKDAGAFLKLMILDGCFILELLQTNTDWRRMGYAVNDPVFSDHGRLYTVPYLKRDMLLLENQLPMQVLTTLLAVSKGTSTQYDVYEQVPQLVLKFFGQPSNIGNINCLHILDVYRKSLISDYPKRPKNRTALTTRSWMKGRGRDTDMIRSATELNEAGISIVRSQTSSLTDISFHRGVLKLPPIFVDVTLKSQLLNVMAFEHLHVGAGNEVTSYVCFMDSIIYNRRDVSLLNSCGIIKNALGSEQAVVDLFNTVSKDITLDPNSSLTEVHFFLSWYCQNPWRLWRAELIRTYFPSRRVELSAYLFILTVVQTVFGVLSYRNSK